MAEPLTVLIVEDSAQSFTAIHSWLTDLGYRILPQAATLSEAEEILRHETPDVLLLDLDLEPRTVTPALKRLKESAQFAIDLKARRPQLTILVHSGEAKLRIEVLPMILNAGISYLVKEAVNEGAHFDRAIRLARAGAAVYDSHVVRFFDKIVPPTSGLGPLTAREWDVAALVEQMTYDQIARCLGIGANRVSELMQSIMRKLNFHNRAEVAVWYQRQVVEGTCPPPPECRERLSL